MSERRLRAPQRAGMLVLAMSLVLLPGAAHAAKPDLVVTGKPEVSPDGPSDGHVIGLRSKVANKKQGRNKTSAAGASVTSLLLTHRPEVRNRVAVSQDVPKLKADESHSGSGQKTLKGFPPGEYAAVVCADVEDEVKERNEKNNCTGIGKIYVTVFSWTGSFGGSSATEGFTEEWGSDGAKLVQVATGEDGRFEYVFTGSVHYSISGSDADGCSYGGAGLTSIPQIGSDGLTLDYHKGQYWGSQGLGGDHPFTWTANCPGESPQELEGPFDFAGGFIVVDPIDAKPMPFGATKLTDFATEQIDQTANRWNWDLAAESASAPRR